MPQKKLIESMKIIRSIDLVADKNDFNGKALRYMSSTKSLFPLLRILYLNRIYL